jgi:Domain of unknown function (DUF4386)
MESSSTRKLTGWLFVISVIAFFVTSTVLSSTFEWPDILREDADTVLTKFEDGGTTLIWTWFAVAWTYFLLIVPILLLRAVLEREDRQFPLLAVATTIGAVSVVAALAGFLRWVFVVPNLADMYLAPGATEATRQGVVAAYTAQHQLAGTMLGEHLSQTLAIVWALIISVGMLNSQIFNKWLGVFGIAASLVYLLNQGEILKTSIPGFTEVPLAGLLGSSLWGLWILITGITLIRTGQPAEPENEAQVETGASVPAKGANDRP